MKYFIYFLLFFSIAQTVKADCASPAAVAGAFNYASGTYNYCNGTSWKSMKYGGVSPHATLIDTDTNNFSSPKHVVIVGNYAYVSATTSDGKMAIVIYNISTISSPVLSAVHTDPVRSNFASMTTDGTYLYGQVSNKVLIYSLASPTAPLLIGEASTFSSNEGGLFVSGNYAYVFDGGNSRLDIVDVTNKTLPSYSGGLQDFANLNGFGGKDIYVLGNYVYLPMGSANKLAIVDATNKASPSLAGVLDDSSHFSYATSVVVSGNYAYVTSQYTNSVVVVDVTTKSNPMYVTSVTNSPNMNGAYRILLSGANLYVAQAGGSNDGVDYVTRLDITTPAAPTVVSNGALKTYTDSSRSISGIAVSGTKLVAVEVDMSLVTFYDMTAGLTTAVTDHRSAVRIAGQRGAYLSGNYHYSVSGYSGVVTAVNVSDPSNPSIHSSISDFRTKGGYAVNGSGNYIYVTGTNDRGFHVYDISNPAAITYVSSYTSFSNLFGAVDIAVQGNYAYIAAQSRSQLTVLNISNPASITFVGLLGSLLSINQVEVAGSYAYICHSTNTLKVLDISTPSAPSVVGTLVDADLGGCHAMTLNGNYVYVASASSKKLSIIDVSTPASPTLVGTLSYAPFSLAAGGILVSGNYVYVDHYGGFFIADVTTKTAPTLNDEYVGGTGYNNVLTRSGNYIFGVNSSSFRTIYAAPLATMGVCSVAGELKYNTANDVLTYCNGSLYMPAGPSPGAGGSGCTTPSSIRGGIYYRTGINKLQYCDGSSWVSIN